MINLFNKVLKRFCSERPSLCGIISNSLRTHNCGELRVDHINTSVALCGWIKHIRLKQFLLVGDSFGSTQLIINDPKLADPVTRESVVEIKGIVQKRPKGMENPKMPTGEVEVIVTELKVLNGIGADLPVSIDDFSQSHESSLMKHRYLHLRKKEMQRNLRFRSDFSAVCREFLVENNGFIEVETPLLFKKTSGGAREFLVPSRHKDLFYALPQSPQLMKQMLMTGGVDRYFQFARCFRDEATSRERQPEFTQIDIEMSFVDPNGVMALTQEMMITTIQKLTTVAQISFDKLSFDQAMLNYGTDKPDLRWDLKIKDVTARPQLGDLFTTSDKIFALFVDSATGSSIDFSQIKNTARTNMTQDFKLIRFNQENPICQVLGLQKGDSCFLSSGSGYSPNKLLGAIRTMLIENLESQKPRKSPTDILKFAWIYDFPLFEENEAGTLVSSHHPFTAPHPDDVRLLEEGKLFEVRGLQYDLVLNGNEVGGGSIRIHDYKMQRRIFTEFLKLDPEEISEFFESLKFGCPPHGGIALGLDRLLATILNVNSIRDVIAFPKSSDGSDPLFRSPTRVSPSDLSYYNISSYPE